MKTRNKIIAVVLMALLMLGVASCTTNSKGVTYQNYEAIVSVEQTEEEGATVTSASTYDSVIDLFGLEEITSNTYSPSTGDGEIVWENEDGEIVTMTFVDYEVYSKESEGLYSDIYHTPLGEKEGIWETIVLYIGWFTYYAGSLFGLLSANYYWLGLLFMTLVIRTLGWPIYAKTNDMSLKMQIAQPELNKIQEKYRNKQDQASQQRMQMETMEVYKRYKINLFGCLMPLLQMPIFIAMYQVVQRFPLSENIFSGVNTNFLWTDLGNTVWYINLPLALIVVGLMILSQWLTTKRTQSMQKHNTYQNAKAQQSQKTMKIVMYVMVLMMGWIALRSAGIAFYWIIGTAYQLFQSYISHRNVDKRKDQLQSRI